MATFINELKNLQATGLTNLGAALKQAFDLLNLYRLQSGIDNYGMVIANNVCLVIATLAVGTLYRMYLIGPHVNF